MVTTMLLAAVLLSPQSDTKPVSLHRVMKLGEKYSYSVKSHLLVEQRELGLDTFLPEELDLNYGFTFDVTKEKADGIVEGRYRRPVMTQIEGENADRGPRTSTEKVNLDFQLDLSPINEILDVKDMAPKKPVKPGGGNPNANFRVVARAVKRAGLAQGDIISSSISEMYRMALFAGSLDSALDFQPKLEDDDVKPGATWKRTASYSPQKLKSKNNKMVMQRLDYVYTYVGVVESEGKKVHRVTATLSSKTDLAAFLRENVEGDEVLAQIKAIPFNFDAKIEYDLDLTTKTTVQAVATSTGGFNITMVEYPDNAIVEQKVKGRTLLRRVAK